MLSMNKTNKITSNKIGRTILNFGQAWINIILSFRCLYDDWIASQKQIPFLDVNSAYGEEILFPYQNEANWIRKI